MSDNHNHSATSNIKIAFFLNLFFALFEIVGFFFTNSLSVLSNGLHDLGDTFSLAISWAFNKVAEKKANENYSYGFRRFSLLAAVFNSLILFAGSIFILSEAIPRLMHPEHSNADGMFIFALVGIVVNLIGFLRLKKGKTMSEQVASLHLLDDVLGLGSVLIVSIFIKFKDIHVLDPILSILITLYVLWKVAGNFKKTIDLFLQAVPKDTNTADIETKIKTITDVVSVHDTHIWSLDGEHNVLTSHVVVKDSATHEQMLQTKCKVKELIERENIQHSTIEIECENEVCKIED